MRTLLLGLLLTTGCGRFERPGATAPDVVRGDDWSMQVPAKASVKAMGSMVQVDADDGMAWIDVRWIDTPSSPVVGATAWAEQTCRPIQWDEPSQPTEGVWLSGGLCTIGHRDHWLITVLEDRGDRTLLTGIMAVQRQRTYEEVWVEFVTSALSLQQGSQPAALIDPEVLKSTLRDTQRTAPVGFKPIPGGGLLSGAIGKALTGTFEAHKKVQVPEFFGMKADKAE